MMLLLLQVQAAWGCSHAVLHSLPFSSSFNAGAGLAWFEGGRMVGGVPPAAAGGNDVEEGVTVGDADSSSSSGWFNMLLTDTLPSCRDPISQQVSAAFITVTMCYKVVTCML
jgi:hypothetical protein